MVLKIGVINEDVKKLQTYLNLKSDGNFGSKTEQAVKDWQTKNGLIADGVVGDDTWEKMGLGINDNKDITMLLTKEELKKICPNLKDDKATLMTNLINKVCPRYKIDTSIRLQAFLAQVLHESGEFSIKTESMYYTTPQRIVDIWPSRFNLTGNNGKLNANNYIKNEQKLANTVYANRMGNGDFSSGDGYRYRGGGYLQLTGKESYSSYAKYLNKSIEETADLVHTSDEYALDAACWEYVVNKKLLESSDNGDFVNITKKINGGLIGQDERVKYYNLCKKYLVKENSNDNIA